MEPLFLKAENADRGFGCPTLRKSGFNGAAFFQSGKCRDGGKPGAHTKLQWSRFFSKRKMACCPARSCGVGLVLQWSRFFSKRKIEALRLRLQSARARFNGAAFFQSGKFRAGFRRKREKTWLQWSRFFSKRKIVQTN